MHKLNKWYPFDVKKGYRQQRPKVKQDVLVLLEGTRFFPHCIVVGYMKNAAGDKSCPYFVTAGCDLKHEAKVIAWCDALSEGATEAIFQAYKQFPNPHQD